MCKKESRLMGRGASQSLLLITNLFKLDKRAYRKG